MKLRAVLYIFISSFTFLGCGGTSPISDPKLATEKTIPIREHAVQSVMWQQNAAEYRALCYQAFNLAAMRLDALLDNPNLKGKKVAIITDIDETVLDNSPYAAMMITSDVEYTPKSWTDWVNRIDAEPLPGAKEFLSYAHDKGVTIFYISNRTEKELLATQKNLEKVKFPNATTEHMLFRGDTGSKEDRFNKVRENYVVLLYLGDNLSDFSSEFRNPSTAVRNRLTDRLKDKFGTEYIVFPNASYGDWEDKGIYHGRHNWTPRQKDSIRKASLRGY